MVHGADVSAFTAQRAAGRSPVSQVHVCRAPVGETYGRVTSAATLPSIRHAWGETMSWKTLLVVGGLAVAAAYYFVSPSTLLALVPPFLR